MPPMRERLWETWMREILERVKGPVNVSVVTEVDGRRTLIIEADHYGEQFYAAVEK